MTDQQQIQIPPGLVCMTSWGLIQSETARAIWELRSHSERQGLVNVGWTMVPGALVEKARNDAVRQMLGAFGGEAQWLLFIDGDMLPRPDALVRILQTAYGTHPWADVVGAYCTLRGELALPTIDTGTGTWESHYPGRGVLEVMRTGAAFLLCKRHVFSRVQPPWFRTRVPARPLDFMAEVDNFARIKFDGRNPFRGLPGKPWEKLLEMAEQDPSAQPDSFIAAEVGEDSGFCDRVKEKDMRIIVDTNIEIPHLDSTTATWTKHKEKIADINRQWKLAVGVG